MGRSLFFQGIEQVAGLMGGKQVLALSGAGLSTESGIPDYRGPRSIQRQIRPVTYQEFVHNPASRARYWARSAVGWPHVAAARPNAGHAALAEMERSRAIIGVITQNVDRLHQASGSRNVLELHGFPLGGGLPELRRPRGEGSPPRQDPLPEPTLGGRAFSNGIG